MGFQPLNPACSCSAAKAISTAFAPATTRSTHTPRAVRIPHWYQNAHFDHSFTSVTTRASIIHRHRNIRRFLKTAIIPTSLSYAPPSPQHSPISTHLTVRRSLPQRSTTTSPLRPSLPSSFPPPHLPLNNLPRPRPSADLVYQTLHTSLLPHPK